MNAQEISQAQQAQAHLFINNGRKIFTSVANACLSMKLAQLRHAFNKSALNFINAACAKINVLQ